MGLYDRHYTQEQFDSPYGRQHMRMGFGQITPVVTWLLITNIAVFLFTEFIPPAGRIIGGFCAIDPSSLEKALQVWRLITYQFLHASFIHILYNMLGLFFLGPTLEMHWGSRKFLTFYLSCGVAGGLFYLLLVAIGFLPAGSMVGASGAILGMLAACAILFPNFVIFLVFFPLPIRMAAIILTAMYILTVVTRGANAGGDAAHLAGMAAGALYVLSEPLQSGLKLRLRRTSWERKMQDHRKLQIEVDRILQKVHDFGIHSLTRKERKILQKATEAEQMRHRR